MSFKRIAALIFWLLVWVSSASGFFGSQLKTASGDFFSQTPNCVGSDGSQSQYPCWENGCCLYEYASGSTVWTKFDPLGLREDFGDGLTGYTNSDGNFVVLTGGTELVNHVEVGVFNAVSTGNNNYLPQVGDAQENRDAANFAAGMVFDPKARETFEMVATGAAIAAEGGGRKAPSNAQPKAKQTAKTNPGVSAQKSPTQSAKKAHGNSDQSTNPNHVYVIKGTDGKLKKPGISGQRMNQNQTSPRANPQVNKHNKSNPNDTVDSHVVKQGASRTGAKSMEQKITDKHAARNNGAMPSTMHKRPTPKVKSREEYIERYGAPDNRDR